MTFVMCFVVAANLAYTKVRSGLALGHWTLDIGRVLGIGKQLVRIAPTVNQAGSGKVVRCGRGLSWQESEADPEAYSMSRAGIRAHG